MPGQYTVKNCFGYENCPEENHSRELEFALTLMYLHNLKEHFVKGQKKTCLRSQIHIKLKRSNDDDSRKHSLNYFRLTYLVSMIMLCLAPF